MRAACEALRASLPLTLALACTTPPTGSSPTAPAAASTSPPPRQRPAATANNDARGAGSQPDYDGEATLLRAAITPRLPAEIPDARAACTAMLDAAVTFYDAVARDEADRTVLLADLKATRAADQTRCEQETSPRAAACVTIRLEHRDAELPWLLDQCTRAFPE